jgi:hypothetical protein
MAEGKMSGILRLADIVFDALDNVVNFESTDYDGPTIIEAVASMPEDTVKYKDPAMPNLMRKLVLVTYTRVRDIQINYSTGVRTSVQKSGMATLIIGIKQILLANETVRSYFNHRITEIDDIDTPQLDGITTMKPFIGVKDRGWEDDLNPFGGQRHERIPIQVWVFQQRYAKDSQQCLTEE